MAGVGDASGVGVSAGVGVAAGGSGVGVSGGKGVLVGGGVSVGTGDSVGEGTGVGVSGMGVLVAGNKVAVFVGGRVGVADGEGDGDGLGVGTSPSSPLTPATALSGKMSASPKLVTISFPVSVLSANNPIPPLHITHAAIMAKILPSVKDKYAGRRITSCRCFDPPGAFCADLYGFILFLDLMPSSTGVSAFGLADVLGASVSIDGGGASTDGGGASIDGGGAGSVPLA
jgi:hypothetical protein